MSVVRCGAGLKARAQQAYLQMFLLQLPQFSNIKVHLFGHKIKNTEQPPHVSHCTRAVNSLSFQSRWARRIINASLFPFPQVDTGAEGAVQEPAEALVLPGSPSNLRGNDKSRCVKRSFSSPWTTRTLQSGMPYISTQRWMLYIRMRRGGNRWL